MAMTGMMAVGTTAWAQASPTPPAPVQMALQDLSASEGGSQALCLDGSPYKYYWRAGLGTDAKNFLLAFRGGGWCTGIALHQGYDINATTIKACASRALGALGSSKGWAPTLGDWDPHGMTSTNCTANPAFCRWSVAYLPYCDGTSFSSARGPPAPTDSSSPVRKLYFRGRLNLIAVLNDMLTRKGLTSAEALVVSGHSAGGLATFLNADFVHSMLPASTSAGLKFFGAVPDGGFCANRSRSTREHCTRELQCISDKRCASFSQSSTRLTGLARRNMERQCEPCSPLEIRVGASTQSAWLRGLQ